MSNNLNREQQQAVQTLSGPMLVLAGAGSGKTRVVTFRIANLIRSGIRPERILAVTFTNKAAKEMRHRVSQLSGPTRSPKSPQPPATPVVGTFHANCVQILRRHAKTLGYPDRFAIYDRNDQETLARDVLRQLRVHSGMMKPAEFLSIISRWKNAGIRWPQATQAASTDHEHVAASGYRRYQQAIKLAGAVDFDDLLLLTEELFQQHDDIRKLEAGRYDHVLVDEYQDTNQSQYAIIKHLAGQHRNLCVVGDDDQSIYGWRGAEVRHILNFANDWPDAKVIRLEANYRSSGAILDAANRLIAFNKQRHNKILRAFRGAGRPPRVMQFNNELEEAQRVAAEIAGILDTRQRQPGDFAILFRTNEQPRVFETELRKAKVPYSLVGSQSFFDRREIRDLLAYLRVVDNPEDEISLLRIINTPQRGIGTKTVEALLAGAVGEGQPMWRYLQTSSMCDELPIPAQQGLERIRGLVANFQNQFSTRSSMMADVLRELINNIDYLGFLDRTYTDPQEASARKDGVEELVNAVAEYESEHRSRSTLSGFLDEVALAGKEFGGSKDKQQPSNSVALMTYHSAKGLEFPLVYMVGMEEGILPHRRSLADNAEDVEEERRLCYVGITRAQDELTLSLALTRKKWGKQRETFASRFLYELTGQADNPNRLRAIQGARKEAARSH
ncbi:MAG: UvrD-helicase domain-containing protein [Pirellulaceae bacterium]|nr:UvrD-helicase domain-containing protein [Pirellulaceae bacterium]